MITIRLRTLAIAAYVLMLLPIALFLLGWTKPYIGIPSIALLIMGAIWILKRDYPKDENVFKLPVVHLAGIAILFGLFVAFSGICGLGVASYDVPWRNALLRDMVNYSWPVVFENGNALVYYITFWTPAALVGKFFGWTGALVGLWLHVTLILVTSHLLICNLLKFTAPNRLWLTAFVMLLWSGLSFIGVVMADAAGGEAGQLLLSTGTGYMDFQAPLGQAYMWHYRNNFETVKFVYNQLPYWLVVPLMLGNRKTHSFMFLGLCLLPYSPWTFLGIIPLLIATAMPEMIEAAKRSGALALLKKILSPANLAALVGIVPVFALFFLASPQMGGPSAITPEIAAAASAASVSGAPFGMLSPLSFSPIMFAYLALFYVLEFALYALFLRKDHKKDPLFWTIVVWLLACPLIWVGAGQSRDFTMNASLPAIFVLMIFILDYLDKHVCGKPLTLPALTLVLMLFIGGMSPFLWTFKDVNQVIYNKSIYVIDEHVYTFSDKALEDNGNFLQGSPEDTAFFKYIAK